MVKLTAEQKADIIKQYKSGNVEAAKQQVKDITDGKTTTTSTTPTKTTTTPTTPTTPTTSTTSSSNQWSSSNYKDSDGYYSGTERNAATGGSEFGISSKSQTAPQTTTQTTPTSDTGSKVRNAWDSLSYQQQQEKLKNNPNLQANLNKYGATNKTPDVVEETPVKEETPKGEVPTSWDYQDNSPERMMQIVNNLEGLYQTDPGLFTNEETFRNFFINGKGRTLEQEQFLMDYYKNRQTYNKYDGITAENAGNLLAHGQLPQNYLSYVQNSNPDRYAAIMDAKDKVQDQIKADASMDTINAMTGEDTDNLAWQKKEGLLVDENGDLIDDRRYHEATQEEKDKVARINAIDAELLDINNTIKHTYEDLVKAYPGASKATLMAMAQDTNNTLLRKKEDLMVERTELAGSVEYMQSERQQQDAAGADTITQLQKNLGMYYSYSPQGMAEYVQAQYAATNVTLSQADNGTYTQKQIALDNALTPIYEQYGDVLFTSKAEAIDQAIRYAEQNGVSLQDALDNTFYAQLYSNPYYLQRVTGGANGYGEWKVIGKDDLGNDIYGFVNSSTGVVVPYGNMSGYYGNYGQGYLSGGDGLTSFVADLESKYNIASNGGSGGDKIREGHCGEPVNDYLKSIGDNVQYDNEKQTKLDSITEGAGPQIGAVAIWDGSTMGTDATKKHGHVAIVTGIDEKNGKITVLESNDDTGLRYKDYLMKNVTGYHIPNAVAEGKINQTSLGGNKFDKNLGNVYADYAEANEKDKAKIAARNGKTTQQMDAETYEYEGWKNAQDLKQSLDMVDRLLYGDIEIPPRMQRMDTIGGDENDLGMWGWVTVGNMSQRNTDWAAAHNLIYNTLGMDKFLDLKSKGATFGALSDDERRAIYDAASAFKANLSEEEYKRQLQAIRDSIIDAGRGYLDNFVYTGSGMDDAATKLGLVKSQKA